MTIIELITAVGVLGILAAIIFAVVNPLEQFYKSADTKRKSDLAQIQRGLEAYYADHGRYPAMSTVSNNKNRICSDINCLTVIDWGTSWTPYMDVVPRETNNSKNYAYWSDTSGQSYVLLASLDRGSKDPQACNHGSACATAQSYNISCIKTCNYGVSSPNVSP